MGQISLVCTVHAEKGRANASELRAILERVRPEVIFLEVPPAAFDDYFSACRRENLESKAVTKYRESHQVELVPVDRPTPEDAFFENNRRLFERVENESQQYRRLIDMHSAYVGTYGFAYLNSDDCSTLWSDVYKEALSTIERLNEPSLVALYDLWKETNERRDKDMMESILQYCRSNAFEKGAFLIGAAHRQSIVDKAREQCAKDPKLVQWDLQAT